MELQNGRAKSVQGGGEEKVVMIIDKHDLYPIMAAVGHVNSTYTPETLLSPTVLYINSETKRYVIIEFGHGEGACVTSIGNGIDFDVTEEQVRGLLQLDPEKMKM